MTDDATKIVNIKTGIDAKLKEQFPDDDLTENWFRIGYLIHDVSRMRRTLYDQHLKPLGITRSQWSLLANIARYSDDGVTSSILGRDLDLGKVTLSGLVDRLETAGYIFRKKHHSDKRAKLIHITTAGSKLVEEMRDVIVPLNRKSCGNLTRNEIAIIELGLKEIKNNLRNMLGED